MKKVHAWLRNRLEAGQTLVLFTFFLAVLILFVGMGIDLSFAYITRANLSKAVDAACLAGIDNYWRGTPAAQTIAINTFRANYGTSGRDAVAPSPLPVFTTDGSGNTTLKVTASAQINTFFIRILPEWKTLTVASTAESLRAHVIMSLVLDRSQSMSGTPMVQLKNAVTNFVNYFDDTVDRASQVSFSSCATLDVPMTKPFKAAIGSAVNALPTTITTGHTASGPGMARGWAQNSGFTPPGGEVVQRVVVFFTDGRANTFSNTFGCGIRHMDDSKTFYNPATANCGTTSCGSAAPYSSYTSAQLIALAEAQAEAVAQQARSANAYVYSIGLGNDINTAFLNRMANVDGVVNQDEPIGISIIAPTPSDLKDAFQTVAKAILLRLTL